jgi:hypothetical protein
VALKRTDVSEDRIASIFRVQDSYEFVPIQELTTSLCNQLELVHPETSDQIRPTRPHLPEDDNHHSHRRGNLKSYKEINYLPNRYTV